VASCIRRLMLGDDDQGAASEHCSSRGLGIPGLQRTRVEVTSFVCAHGSDRARRGTAAGSRLLTADPPTL